MTTVLVLTGHIGSGKSTVAARVVALARERGLRCDGLLCSARLDVDGRKVGIDGARLGTGARRPLASRDVSSEGLRCGIWTFEPGAMEWSLDAVLDAIRLRPDLLVVDELGPMELNEGTGLAPVIPKLKADEVPLALVLVRSALLPSLMERLMGCEVRVYEVTPESRDALPQTIAREWFGAGQ
jgi:nucleoside-triphosphatase THEP1